MVRRALRTERGARSSARVLPTQRSVADARGLASDEILLSRDAWSEIRDAVYLVEAAAGDAAMDLEDAAGPEEVRAIVRRLVEVIGVLVDTPMEPRAVGSEG